MSALSRCKFLAFRLTLARPWKEVHIRTSLLLQQCPICLVCLGWFLGWEVSSSAILVSWGVASRLYSIKFVAFLCNFHLAFSRCHLLVSIVFSSLEVPVVFWRYLWCNCYRRRKWTRRHEFKSWTKLIAFHIALIPLRKKWIQLFSPQLWVNSRTDWFFSHSEAASLGEGKLWIQTC